MSRKAQPLPAIISPVAPDLRRFLDRIKEAVEGKKTGGFVTRGELLDTGAFQGTPGGGIGFVDNSSGVTCTSPPAPLSLTANGAMTSVMLSWDGTFYNTCYSHTEIWRASTDDLGVATIIGTTASGIFADAVGSDSNKYYWVRFVNVLGDTGSFNATTGVNGVTAPDVDYLLDQLANSITSGQLSSGLAGAINSTFHQTGAPTAKTDGSSLVAGDTWLDSDDENKMYLYDPDAIIGPLHSATPTAPAGDWVNAQDGNIITAINAAAGAQGTADGKVQTFYLDAAPVHGDKVVPTCTNNAAATPPVVCELFDLSKGDLWVKTLSGINTLHRYPDSGTTWVNIQDSGIGDAIANAAGAQATADGKVQAFYQNVEPVHGAKVVPTCTNNAAATPPVVCELYDLDEGDLWVNTTSGANTLHKYSLVTSDFVSVRDGGISSALDDASNAQTTADGEIVGFFQNAEPDATSTPLPSFGDIWIDTDKATPLDSTCIYRYQDSTAGSQGILGWALTPNNAVGKVYLDAYIAGNVAADKTKTYYQTGMPDFVDDGTGTGTMVRKSPATLVLQNGDTWVDLDSENMLWAFKSSTSMWEPAQDGKIVTVENIANGKVTTYFEATAPSSPTFTMSTGDLWFNTTNSSYAMSRWQDTGATPSVDGWVSIPDSDIAQAIIDAGDAQSAADGKVTSYFLATMPDFNDTATSGTFVRNTPATLVLRDGDLWSDTSASGGGRLYSFTCGSDCAAGTWDEVGLATQAYVGQQIVEQVGYCEQTVTSSGVKTIATAYNTKTACTGATLTGATFSWKDDGAMAQDTHTVSTRIGDRFTTVQTVASSVDGIEGKFSVKIDNAGHVSGFGLISTTNGATPTSEFGIRADNFWIAPAAISSTTAPTTFLYAGKVWVHSTTGVTKYYTGSTWSTTPQALPFTVQASPVYDTDGTTVLIPEGVYMNSAYIKNAAITNAKIGKLAVDTANIAALAVSSAKIASLAVTNAKINDLNATKITAGYISADRINANTITGDHIDANTIKASNLVIQSVAQAVDATWDNQFNHDVRIVVSPGSGTTPPVVDGSWFMSSEDYALWSASTHTTAELTPSTWGAVKTIGFYRKELDGTDNNVIQAALQSRTDVYGTTLSTSSGTTSSSIVVVSTSGFPDSGTIIVHHGHFPFVYTSKTATTFDGVAQSISNVSAGTKVTLATTWYLQVYKDTATWAKYRVLATRRATTYASNGDPLYVDAITCRVELVSHRGVPTSISGGTNNFTHTVRTARTLDPVLVQVSRYSADDPATIINRGTTTIDGGSITANSIDVDRIDADSLNAHIITVSPPGGGAEAWTTATAYAVNDQVFIDGNIYNCITAHTSSSTIKPPHVKWGAVVGSSSSSGSRLQITSNKIEVWDSVAGSEVLRVKIGYLGV
jgi:hypothetical protein